MAVTSCDHACAFSFVEDWTGPECLRWLHERTGEINYLNRACDWPFEVARFAEHEGIGDDEWEANALDEMRGHIIALMAGDSARAAEQRLSI